VTTKGIDHNTNNTSRRAYTLDTWLMPS